MDARFSSYSACRFVILLLLLFSAMGAKYETANFAVEAPAAEIARQIAETAERCRMDLATLWLGKDLPDWPEKCPVKVYIGNDLGAGGKTSFIFDKGTVYDWDMEVQGPLVRILDSVLPHEITHMVLASHFGRPIPRWLDEGIATSVEHQSEQAKYRQMLRHFLQAEVGRCFPFNQMVAMKEYPEDPMPFYAQGFSLVEYLLQIGTQFGGDAHCRLVRFADSAMQNGDWNAAISEHYGIQNLGQLQLSWIRWVGMDQQPLQAAAERKSVYDRL